jgi:hypothetical protein
MPMNDYIRFVIIALAGMSAGVVLYRVIGKTKFPISSLVGIALGGSAAGALAGMILVSVFRIEDIFMAAWGYPLLISLGSAIGFQRSLENWTDHPDKGGPM